MPASAQNELHDDLAGIIDDLNDEFGKLMDIAVAICEQLKHEPNKQLLHSLVERFNTTWVEDKLDDLDSAITNTKDVLHLG